MHLKQVLLDEARAYVHGGGTPGRPWRDVMRELCEALDERPSADPVFVLFDGPPEHQAGRFVEVENERGVSVRAGEWECVNQTTGVWRLGPFYCKPYTPALPAEQSLDARALAALASLGEWVLDETREQWGDLDGFTAQEKMLEFGLLTQHVKESLTADDIEDGQDVKGYTGRCGGTLCGGETAEGEECQHVSDLALHAMALLKHAHNGLLEGAATTMRASATRAALANLRTDVAHAQTHALEAGSDTVAFGHAFVDRILDGLREVTP